MNNNQAASSPRSELDPREPRHGLTPSSPPLLPVEHKHSSPSPPPPLDPVAPLSSSAWSFHFHHLVHRLTLGAQMLSSSSPPHDHLTDASQPFDLEVTPLLSSSFMSLLVLVSLLMKRGD